MEAFDPQHPVSLTQFGSPNAKRKVGLMVSHDAPLQPFLAAFPEYAEACPQAHHLPLLAESQRDVGTLYLAQNIQSALRKRRQDIEVLLIQGHTPRTVADLNRLFADFPGSEANGIWHNFPFDEYPELYAAIAEIHQAGVVQIRRWVRELLNPGDILLDLHSMGPFTPPIHLRPTPGNLGEIVDLWRFKVYNQARRVIDLITLVTEDEETRRMSSESFIGFIKEELTALDLPFTENAPYMGRPFLVSASLGKKAERRGLHYAVVDFPKDFLATVPEGELKQFDLCNIDLDPEKCQRIIHACVEAICNQLDAN